MVLNDKDSLLLLKFVKVLSNEDRLGIVKLLKKDGVLCAMDIGKQFYLEQSTTSHHLNLMKRVGLVKVQKKGRNIFYSLDQDMLRKRLEQLNLVLL